MGPVQKRQSLFASFSKDLPTYTLVFFAYFVSAKLGLYIYYTFHTSPALIWPSLGIGIAAVIFRGYRMCIPIFLAQFLALISQTPDIYLTAFIIAVAYAIEAAAALYVLRYFDFEPAFEKLRNTIIFVVVAFVVTLIEPVIGTAAQAYAGTLTVGPLLNVGRAWGGGVFSMLVFTPFILMWYPWRSFLIPQTRAERIEIGLGFALLLMVNYFLFWTSYPQFAGIAVIFFLPAVLIWLALRLRTRWVTLAFILTSIEGVIGSIVHSSVVPLNVQLLSDEVYIGLIAAIFLVFVAVVEERRAAFRQMEAAYHSTSAADQAKSDFIAILAHELRNPLAPIVSSLEWLGLQPITQEASEVIVNAQEHADMIRRLLDDLLDTARLTQKKLKLQKKNISVKKIINQSILSTQEEMKSHRHKVLISMPAQDIILYADSVRLKQIIINLLMNASKYSKSGSSIELSVERVRNEAIVRVKDNGIGIKREKFPYIFEPFKQIEPNKRQNSGLGIGLFLAKNLAEMHGGRIEAASGGLGQGSTFSVYLPIPARKVVESATPEAKKAKAIGAHRILVVDDNEAAADALQRLLLHYGHEVETAYFGEQALQRSEAFQPEFILLDIGMPDMDGYAVAREIRDTGLKTTIIAVSGYGQESDKTQSKEAGFDHHLVKPVNVTEVLALLNTTKPQRVPATIRY